MRRTFVVRPWRVQPTRPAPVVVHQAWSPGARWTTTPLHSPAVHADGRGGPWQGEPPVPFPVPYQVLCQEPHRGPLALAGQGAYPLLVAEQSPVAAPLQSWEGHQQPWEGHQQPLEGHHGLWEGLLQSWGVRRQGVHQAP